MTPEPESSPAVDSNHGHEHPVRELRVLLGDILCALVDISTRTPYCSTVCLCLNNSLTHSLVRRHEPGHTQDTSYVLPVRLYTHYKAYVLLTLRLNYAIFRVRNRFAAR